MDLPTTPFTFDAEELAQRAGLPAGDPVLLRELAGDYLGAAKTHELEASDRTARLALVEPQRPDGLSTAQLKAERDLQEAICDVRREQAKALLRHSNRVAPDGEEKTLRDVLPTTRDDRNYA